MNKPNFFLIGAMKCGTTTLRHGLSSHPSVFWPHPEVRFFCSNAEYRKGIDHYLKNFRSAEGCKAIGGGGGYYSFWSFCPETAQRIQKNYPDAKILYMVRHPIERLVSHWSWEISRGLPLGDFAEAVKNHKPLMEISQYWFQINVYRKYFPDEQIKVVFLEDLKTDPTEFYQSCFKFLEVDPTFIVPDAEEKYNATDSRLTDKQITMKIRKILPINNIIKFVPNQLRSPFKAILKKSGKAEPQWTSQLRKEVESVIVPDSHQFLDFCGRDRKFWQFDFY